jgi:hypothetical protein
MDKVLRLAVVIAVLLAGSGVFYYYVIFLPNSQRQAVQEAEQTKQDQATKEAARKAQYASCLVGARADYETNWENACKDLASAQQSQYQNCLSDKFVMSNPYMGENYCKKMFTGADASPNCSLPGARADSANKTYQDEQQKCLSEAQLGM